MSKIGPWSKLCPSAPFFFGDALALIAALLMVRIMPANEYGRVLRVSRLVRSYGPTEGHYE